LNGINQRSKERFTTYNWLDASEALSNIGNQP